MTFALKRFARTALYEKNLPLRERLLRTTAAIVLTTAGVSTALSLSGFLRGVLIGTAAFVLLTAFVGFCPACYFLKLRPSVPRRP